MALMCIGGYVAPCWEVDHAHLYNYSYHVSWTQKEMQK